MKCLWIDDKTKKSCRKLDYFEIGFCPEHLKEYLITKTNLDIDPPFIRRIVDKLRVLQVKFSEARKRARCNGTVH